jgi:hypothetical protein
LLGCNKCWCHHRNQQTLRDFEELVVRSAKREIRFWQAPALQKVILLQVAKSVLLIVIVAMVMTMVVQLAFLVAIAAVRVATQTQLAEVVLGQLLQSPSLMQSLHTIRSVRGFQQWW